MKVMAHAKRMQRLDRLLRWSGLWLLRVAAWIVQVAGISAPIERAIDQALRPKLDYVAKGICKVIAAKAVLRLQRQRGLRIQHMRMARDPGHFHRRAIGARLRKRVRADDLRAKISALLMLLHDAEREIARCARRLRCGLSRRLGGLMLASLEIACLVSACLIYSAAISDSS